jgi:hypothetical protein
VTFQFGKISLANPERDNVGLSFQYGKRRFVMNEDNKITADEAKQALGSAAKLESAGWRRAVPDRWFGLGVAVLIGSMFAVYALKDPYPYIAFPILALIIFIAAAREKVGAYGREFPNSKRNRAAMLLFMIVLVVMFFGSVYLRRAYDAAWISLLAGLLVGLLIFIASENERRAYLAKSEQAGAK